MPELTLNPRLRAAARGARHGLTVARTRRWTSSLAARLRRSGGRLVLDAPAALAMDAAPHLRVVARGGSGGTLRLRIGEGVRFGRGVTIEVWAGADNTLDLGAHCLVDDGASFQLRGGTIRVGHHSQIRQGVLLKSEGELVVGERALLGAWSAINCACRVEVGELAAFGERVSVLDSDHTLDGSPEPFLDRPLRLAPVWIGANTMVGTNTVVTRGARIGRDAAVGAGSVVSDHPLPDGWLSAGVPARAIRALAVT